MNQQEFISEIQSFGATILPKASERSLELTQSALQQMRSAMIPMELLDFYKNAGGGILLGDAEIFGPDEADRANGFYTMPSIVQINRELSSVPSMRGRAVFGRNSLFLFGFDAFGYFYMLDNMNLVPLRKYDSLYKAMRDCLIVGKI